MTTSNEDSSHRDPAWRINAMRYLSDAKVAFAALVITRLIVALSYQGRISDVPYYDDLAYSIAAWLHRVPGIPPPHVEYPPLAMVFLVMPMWIAKALKWLAPTLSAGITYKHLFSLQCLVVEISAAGLCWHGLRKEHDLSQSKFLWAWTLLPLILCDLLYDRLDIVVGSLLVVFAVYAWTKRDSTLPWGILALGTLFKLIPGLFLLPMIALTWASGKSRNLLKGVVVFALVLGLGACFAQWLFGNAAWYFFGFHAKRGLQIESGGAILGWFIHSWRGSFIATVGSGSHNAFFPGHMFLARVLSILSPLSFAGCWALWFCRECRNTTNNSGALAKTHFFGYLTASLLLLILAAPVFSPQYLLWLAPIAALHVAAAQRWKVSAALLALVLLYTAWIFPFHYFEYIIGIYPDKTGRMMGVYQSKAGQLFMLGPTNIGALVLAMRWSIMLGWAIWLIKDNKPPSTG